MFAALLGFPCSRENPTNSFFDVSHKIFRKQAIDILLSGRSYNHAKGRCDRGFCWYLLSSVENPQS